MHLDVKGKIDNALIGCQEQPSKLMVSRWVNEPLLPWPELLTAHDVARLTRRPTWWLRSMSLVGKFPKRRRFRGHTAGWFRADVADWLSRALRVTLNDLAPTRDRNAGNAQRPCQRPLPFACDAHRAGVRRCQKHTKSRRSTSRTIDAEPAPRGRARVRQRRQGEAR
jgi:predicted DNA-binding transcriptional regulator AlpA